MNNYIKLNHKLITNIKCKLIGNKIRLYITIEIAHIQGHTLNDTD